MCVIRYTTIDFSICIRNLVNLVTAIFGEFVEDRDPIEMLQSWTRTSTSSGQKYGLSAPGEK